MTTALPSSETPMRWTRSGDSSTRRDRRSPRRCRPSCRHSATTLAVAVLEQPDVHAVDRQRVADDLDRALHDMTRDRGRRARPRRARAAPADRSARSISTTRRRVSSRTIVLTDLPDELDLGRGAGEIDPHGQVAGGDRGERVVEHLERPLDRLGAAPAQRQREHDQREADARRARPRSRPGPTTELGTSTTTTAVADQREAARPRRPARSSEPSAVASSGRRPTATERARPIGGPAAVRRRDADLGHGSQLSPAASPLRHRCRSARRHAGLVESSRAPDRTDRRCRRRDPGDPALGRPAPRTTRPAAADGEDRPQLGSRRRRRSSPWARPATATGRRSSTSGAPSRFAELDARTDAVARGLIETGVRAGDSVAILCRNHRYFFEIAGALAKLGVDARLPQHRLRRPADRRGHAPRTGGAPRPRRRVRAAGDRGRHRPPAAGLDRRDGTDRETDDDVRTLDDLADAPRRRSRARSARARRTHDHPHVGNDRAAEGRARRRLTARRRGDRAARTSPVPRARDDGHRRAVLPRVGMGQRVDEPAARRHDGARAPLRPRAHARPDRAAPRRGARRDPGDAAAHHGAAAPTCAAATTRRRCGSCRSRARRCPAISRPASWTRSATSCTTSTARPRPDRSRSRRPPTSAPRRPPPVGRRAARSIRLLDDDGHDVAPDASGRIFVQGPVDVLGLHRRPHQVDGRRLHPHRRHRALRPRRAASSSTAATTR